MTVGVLWPFPMVPLVGLLCVILVFPDHTHLLLVVCYGDLVKKIKKILESLL